MQDLLSPKITSRGHASDWGTKPSMSSCFGYWVLSMVRLKRLSFSLWILLDSVVLGELRLLQLDRHAASLDLLPSSSYQLMVSADLHPCWPRVDSWFVASSVAMFPMLGPVHRGELHRQRMVSPATELLLSNISAINIPHLERQHHWGRLDSSFPWWIFRSLNKNVARFLGDNDSHRSPADLICNPIFKTTP